MKERVSGAAGFVDAVRRVAAGGCAVDPEVVSLMLASRRRDDPLHRLTGREREVLALMAVARAAICAASTRAVPQAPARPRAVPTATNTRPSPITRRSTSRRPAPRAIRMPISRARRVTDQAVTPARPTEARIKPNRPMEP